MVAVYDHYMVVVAAIYATTGNKRVRSFNRVSAVNHKIARDWEQVGIKTVSLKIKAVSFCESLA